MTTVRPVLLAVWILFLDRDWWAWNGWSAIAGLAQILAAGATLGTLWFFGVQITGSIRAARPRLEPRLDGDRRNYWPSEGLVQYVSGTGPAFDIEVWLQASSGGVVTDRCPTLIPGQGQERYSCTLPNTPTESIVRWPFKDVNLPAVNHKTLQELEWFIGLTWRDAANRQYRALWKTKIEDDEIRHVLSELPRPRWRGQIPR